MFVAARMNASRSLILWMALSSPAWAQDRLQSSDLLKLRAVAGAAFSPDATRIAYVVENNDGPGRPYGQVWVMTLADGKSIRFGRDQDASGSPEWSPDGQSIAYRGRVGDKSGLVVSRADGSGARFLAEMNGTNAPLPGSGRTIAWAPDGKRIAFVSATPGPETANATGDPIVITRYLYKPDAAEGMTHFNDNRRLHLFVVDVASGRVEQLTDGPHYEHSIDWSPKSDEVLFLTNRDADEDIFFNYDIYALKVSDKSVRRITATESSEYHPRWSPDGTRIAFQATRRGLTDRETTMEDTHVWVMNADGTGRREIGLIDNRQGTPEWSGDGSAVLFTVQERGNVRLYRAPIAGGTPEALVSAPGSVGGFSVAKESLAYSFAGPSDQAELYVRRGGAAPQRVTDLNAAVLGKKALGDVESFTFVSNETSLTSRRF